MELLLLIHTYITYSILSFTDFFYVLIYLHIFFMFCQAVNLLPYFSLSTL
jgi:hypothetical protein